jgi:glycosyltransferase involved in cell wall biosynthesis
MRVCLIGKYPPIEGGVSMRTYSLAQTLARRGHEIHLVTNATEVEPAYRMFMRPEDWRCYDEVSHTGGGSVRVHATEAADWKQAHIPHHNAFATKLASEAIRVIREHDLEVVYSYYLEPYGVAGHLASLATGRPHVIKNAGSDTGRLWKHPQFRPLYEEIVKAAAYVITGRSVVERLKALGLDDRRISARMPFQVSLDQFHPQAKALDVPELISMIGEHDPCRAAVWGTPPRGDVPVIGMYGKIGKAKGTTEILHALRALRDEGIEVHLIAMSHVGQSEREAHFRKLAVELGLERHVLQIPFLPHWRVPELIRRCTIVCCLENSFPIPHAPIVAREVLACGVCLVGSAEVLDKQPAADTLVDGQNCVRVRDIPGITELTDRLRELLRDPSRTQAIAGRGRAYAEAVEPTMAGLGEIHERIFRVVLDRHAGVRSARGEAPRRTGEAG